MRSTDEVRSGALARLRRALPALMVAAAAALLACGDNNGTNAGGVGGSGTAGAAAGGDGGFLAGTGGVSSAGGGVAAEATGGAGGQAGPAAGRGGLAGAAGGVAGGAAPAPSDACSSEPCANGGVCRAEAAGGFSCTCPPGFTGVTCAANIDDCLVNPCRNGGTCRDGVAAFACTCGPAFTGARCELPRFQASGDLTPCGGPATATGISADGRVVIGFCGSHHGFAWTAAGGFVDLGVAGPPYLDSIPIAVNGEGTAVLSRFIRADNSEGVLRARTDAAPVDLFLQAPDTVLYANAASRDLSVVVGGVFDATSQGYVQRPFRWTAATGLGDLPWLALETPGCGVLGVSADGNVAAGVCYDSDNVLRAVRWTTAGGRTVTPAALDLQGATSYANGVSGDGNVIFGYIQVGSVAHAFRARGDEPLEDLGALPQATTATVLASSDDGRVLVGVAEHTSYPFTDFAMVWDEDHGMRTVADALAATGTDLTGWSLTSAQAVSADGSVIVGLGTSPDHVQRFWLARPY